MSCHPTSDEKYFKGDSQLECCNLTMLIQVCWSIPSSVLMSSEIFVMSRFNLAPIIETYAEDQLSSSHPAKICTSTHVKHYYFVLLQP